jgi:hypothetical protein
MSPGIRHTEFQPRSGRHPDGFANLSILFLAGSKVPLDDWGRSQSRNFEDAMRPLTLLGDRLAQEAKHMREQAAKSSSAREHEKLLNKARQAETPLTSMSGLRACGHRPDRRAVVNISHFTHLILRRRASAR